MILFCTLATATVSGEQMMKETNLVSWVVYQITIHGKESGMNAVCEQSEWDEMERAQPGHHKLIQAGITNEGEAERLARGTAGDPLKRS